MTVYIKGLSFAYELQRVTQLFYFGEKVEVLCDETPPESFLKPDCNCNVEFLYSYFPGNKLCVDYRNGQIFERQEFPADPKLPPESLEWKLGAMVYQILSKVKEFYPPWGILTGIRPIKLFLSKIQEGMREQDLESHFLKDRLLDRSRFDLALETAKAEAPLIARSTPDSVSLYVSIPFCPSRCAYCSFVSHSVEQAVRLIPAYVEKLCDEILVTSNLIRQLHLRVRTIYFGGGTPTVLTASQLEKLMKTVWECFPSDSLWEYTVEAGRPDTITREKLEIIRQYGAGRVSINPQTLQDRVLETVGRRHTAAQCLEQVRLARNLGLRINMDLIAGLPSDTLEGFQESVKGVIAASPDNITLHTLTVKRAARISVQQARDELDLVRGMMDDGYNQLKEQGYRPYYLYRQSGTLSALENVGYAKPGTACLYNVYMMDETHSVLAVGAGGSTRLRHPVTGKIERIYNYKYPYEYLSRFPEILRRKEQIPAFFNVPL